MNRPVAEPLSQRRAPLPIVLDDTALSALGAGNIWLSSLVAVAAGSTGTHVYVPALCLSAAVAERPLLADHIGGLPSITVLDLTYTGASLAGQFIAQGTSWRQAQAVVAARPSVEWPTGAAVATSTPQAYHRHAEVRLIPLTSP